MQIFSYMKDRVLMPFDQLDQPQSIRTVFFDAGFTLLRPHPSTAEICQQVCRQLDLHVDLDALKQRAIESEDYFFQHQPVNKQTWGSDATITTFWNGYYAHLLRPFIQEHDERRLLQLAQSVTEEFDKHTSWQTFPDVLPTLEALKARDYTLGVISDWGIALGSILQKLNLTQYFDCLIVSAVTRYAKPSPQLYDLALQRANAIADYTVHIGDSYILDVLGARSVGITPILLDRREHVQPDDVDCILVRSLADLLDLLEVFR